MAYKKILVPLDGSSFSKRAVDGAIKVAKTDHASIILLGVVEIPPAAFEGYTEFAVNIEANEELKKKLSRSLNEEADKLRAKGLSVAVIVKEGLPIEEIDATVESEGVDLIVMTTHGRRGFSRFLLGSVAEKVVRTASCSVLIVRPTAPELKVLEGNG
ncbi:MAG: universal stress protein [Deltaproteobacteria bacterium]|nr:MAG: universal stress protein [Deltaproteobacteria bacterium]